MSAYLMGLAMANGPAKAADRFMLVALADHAHDDGTSIYPSVATLASKVCVQQRAARSTIRRLEQGGWISTKIGGGRRSTRYQINVVLLADPGRPRPISPVVHDRPARSSTADEPSVEPSPEPSSIQDLVGGA